MRNNGPRLRLEIVVSWLVVKGEQWDISSKILSHEPRNPCPKSTSEHGKTWFGLWWKWENLEKAKWRKEHEREWRKVRGITSFPSTCRQRQVDGERASTSINQPNYKTLYFLNVLRNEAQIRLSPKCNTTGTPVEALFHSIRVVALLRFQSTWFSQLLVGGGGGSVDDLELEGYPLNGSRKNWLPILCCAMTWMVE